MDNELDQNKDNAITPEEQEFDKEALSEVKTEELRSKIAEDFGISPEDEPELLTRLVEREQSYREKLSSAIKQKINWREKATTTSSQKLKENPEQGKSQDNKNVEALTIDQLNVLLDEREAKRELEKLNLPEGVTSEVKDIAKVRGISVRDALELPYIQSRIMEVEKERRIESSAPRRSGSGGYVSSYDASKAPDFEDFALDTPEGRKQWEEAKEAHRKYLSSRE